MLTEPRWKEECVGVVQEEDKRGWNLSRM